MNSISYRICLLGLLMCSVFTLAGQSLPPALEILSGGGTWVAEGAGRGLAGRTEKQFSVGLDGQIVHVKTYNVNAETGTFGLRSEGVRYWQMADSSWHFTEYDKLGQHTSGKVTASGRDLYYDYVYQNFDVRDAWHYLDDHAYDYVVGLWNGTDWDRIFHRDTFRTVAPAVESGWMVVYAHDEHGRATEGSLAALRAAVKSGKEVRLRWKHTRSDKNAHSVEHFAEASFLTVLNDHHVLAQIEPIIGQTPNFREASITLKEQLQWSMLASTRGTHDTMMRNPATGELASHRPLALPMAWLIRP
ncbi:hypothetical protein [Lewinella sp. W8]|uniref:hypothetical protein n=1 Tax=Lewinella sp. W8 TaxID=2528208 RepID=UPI0010681438|nr:hypothetical protein [Lewinella sp. W8]MTB51282.1 hypothetical protein [Lewinella sp. W8]